MEILGGRKADQISYVMPRLNMHIHSQISKRGIEGGGEVHFVSACASGRITRVMLADICASPDIFEKLTSSMRRCLLRRINAIWQCRIVCETNQRLSEFAHEGAFATACLATYFSPTRTLTICNIGNPPALLFRAGEKAWTISRGEPQIGDGGGCEPIEGVLTQREYRHQRIKLSAGDIVVLLGNGFTQSSFSCGGLASHQKLLACLNDSPNCDPMSRLSHLIGLVFDESEPPEDRTIIVCKATNTRVRFRDTLLAPFRWLRGACDATTFQKETGGESLGISGEN